MRSLIVIGLLFIVPSHAWAGESETASPGTVVFYATTKADPWHVRWLAPATDDGQLLARRFVVADAAAEPSGRQPLHAAAIEHSDAYLLRGKIHKYASVATLPLFGAELWLGQALYNTPSNANSLRGVHAAVGAGIVGLAGVNTVTGAWNLFGTEGRQDREGRALRLVHGLLMMASDVGFVATTATGPNSHSQRQALTFETNKVLHRNLAVASIGVGTLGYLIMLFGNH